MSEPVAPAAAPGGGEGSEGKGHAARLAGAAWLLGGFCITLPFTIQLFRSGDEWWHLALGRLILSHGIPTTEPFSFVATQHTWVEQQWLYEVALASPGAPRWRRPRLPGLGPGGQPRPAGRRPGRAPLGPHLAGLGRGRHAPRRL